MARDFYHNNVREALEKDGWRITNDPYTLKVDDIGMKLTLVQSRLLQPKKKNRPLL